MVRVYGPAMSLDASGTLANTITFSKWKGRNYVRERVVPSNPKSGAQTGRRAMMKFLAQQWAARGAPQRATWQGIADGLVASPFNAYVSENMKNWHNYLAPSVTYPAARVQTAGTDADDDAAFWDENRIRLNKELTVANSNWGVVVFASLVMGFTPSVGTVIQVQLAETTEVYSWYWTPPSVATWYFRMRNFTADGLWASLNTEFSAAP